MKYKSAKNFDNLLEQVWRKGEDTKLATMKRANARVIEPPKVLHDPTNRHCAPSRR
jgi:hypothetical protein